MQKSVFCLFLFPFLSSFLLACYRFIHPSILLYIHSFVFHPPIHPSIYLIIIFLTYSTKTDALRGVLEESIFSLKLHMGILDREIRQMYSKHMDTNKPH